jgi:hypothetical protein
LNVTVILIGNTSFSIAAGDFKASLTDHDNDEDANEPSMVKEESLESNTMPLATIHRDRTQTQKQTQTQKHKATKTLSSKQQRVEEVYQCPWRLN